MEKLLEKDVFLIKNVLHEGTLSHKLGCYLQNQFPEMDVDCEYNKHEVGTKMIVINDKEEEIRPDIVVHRRGDDSNNLVVIEVKKEGSRKERDWAVTKLTELTRKDGKYQYKYGVLVEVQIRTNEILEGWYVDGKVVLTRSLPIP